LVAATLIRLTLRIPVDPPVTAATRHALHLVSTDHDDASPATPTFLDVVGHWFRALDTTDHVVPRDERSAEHLTATPWPF